MPVTNVITLPSVLETHAKRIHKLIENWSENTIELGKELKAARDLFPVVAKGARPGWKNWLRTEAGLGDGHALSLIKIAEKFSGRQLPKGLSSEIMRLLTIKTVPESAEAEIINRLKKGENVSKRKAAKIIKEHRFPKPAEANKQAKETGIPVQASDGYIYFGTSKEDAQLGEDRRTIVYGVKDAIVALADIELSPINFIKFMLPHQRWDRNEEKKIEKARLWLNELAKEWSKWEDR